MHIVKIYKYIKNGITYTSSELPENTETIETMNILNAEKGYCLERVTDGEYFGNSVLLKDNDSENMYREKPVYNPYKKISIGELLSGIISCGVSQEQIDEIIKDNKNQLDGITNDMMVERNNIVLNELCKKLSIESDDLDRIFGLR